MCCENFRKIFEFRIDSTAGALQKGLLPLSLREKARAAQDGRGREKKDIESLASF